MSILATAVLSLLVLFVGYATLLIEPAPLPEEPAVGYIDMHVHTAGIGVGSSEAFVGADMANSYKYPIYFRALGVRESELLEHGDGLVIERIANNIAESRYIDRAVILAFDGVVDSQGELDRDRTQFYVPNELLIEELPKYPQLMFGASINPLRPDSLERLDRVAENGAVLIKWIPNIMLFDPSDERIAPFYSRMADLCIPLLTHIGAERSFAGADDSLGDPEKLRLPLSLGVTVIAAHLATTGEADGEAYYDRLVRMLREYPNLYTDISSLTQINKLGYLKRFLKNEDLLDRIVYGTDWPLQFFPLVSPYFHLNSISLREARAVQKLDNQWDKDVVLKHFIGVPSFAFRQFDNIVPEACRTSRAEDQNDVAPQVPVRSNISQNP